MTPLISIIVPGFNKEKYISETLDSLLAQTYKNFEVIVVDDGSTDGTVACVESFKQSDTRIRLFVSGENRGANYCRNFGLGKAKGDWIIFLDADDLLAPWCLEARIKMTQAFTGYNLLVFSMSVFNLNPGDDARKWLPGSKDPLKDFLSHNLPWQTMQAMWKNEIINRLNGFDESFQRLQDVELHTRALLSESVNYKLVVDKPDCFYRIDAARKNFSSFAFIQRWTRSAVKYVNKFQELVPHNYKKYLSGTVFQTYLQVLLYFKTRQISSSEFKELQAELLSCAAVKNLNFIKKSLLQFTGWYNLGKIRIPGINKFVSILLRY